MKRLLALLIILFLAASTVQPAFAEEPLGMAVSPPTFELNANAGDTIKNSLRVDNLTGQTLNLVVDRKNFSALGDEGQVSLNDEDSTFSLASWIHVDPEGADIPAHGSKVFTFTIAVPPNAEPGGRFGSIVFKTIPKPVVGQSGLAVGQEVSSLILLRLAGTVKEQASIASFTTPKSFQEYGPIQFEALIKNEGNIHLKPTGTITITDFFGRKVGTIPLDSKNVLPDAARKLNAAWPKKSLFGKYTATLSLQYGSRQQITTASTTFVVIPYKMLLLWTAVIALIGALIYWRRDRLRRSFKVLFGKD